MPNAWVEHVRQYAKDNNLTYACAIPYAKATYTKKDGTKSTPSKSLPPSKPEPKAKAKPKAKTKKQIKEEEDRLREQRNKERAESDKRHRKLIERLDKEKQKEAHEKFEQGQRESKENNSIAI